MNWQRVICFQSLSRFSELPLRRSTFFCYQEIPVLQTFELGNSRAQSYCIRTAPIGPIYKSESRYSILSAFLVVYDTLSEKQHPLVTFPIIPYPRHLFIFVVTYNSACGVYGDHYNNNITGTDNCTAVVYITVYTILNIDILENPIRCENCFVLYLECIAYFAVCLIYTVTVRGAMAPVYMRYTVN